MEHLALEIFDRSGNSSKYAYLPEDTSISITDTSEVFASGDVWSHSFSLNVTANADIFGTSGDMHGSRLHEQLNGRRARLWVDGLPLYLGYLKLDDEVDVNSDGNVDVSFESGQKTFEQLIEGGKANQVPMMSDIMIGMALWRKRWTCVEAKLSVSATYKSGSLTSDQTVLTHDVKSGVIGDEDSQLTYFVVDGEDDGTSVQEYPRMVFPKGTFFNMDTKQEETINCINVDNPYDDSHPFCNVALCYQKYGYTITEESNGQKTTRDDYTSSPSAQRGYEVMPANRVNSAPNFFVIYWVKALMKHIGIHIEENQMMNVEDMRRLFFVNTSCSYEETQYLRSPKYDGAYGKYQFSDAGPLVSEYMGELKNEKYGSKTERWNGVESIAKPENCGLECKSFDVESGGELWDGIDHLNIIVQNIAGMSDAVRAYYDGSGHGWFGNRDRKDGGSPAKQQYGYYRDKQKNLLLHKAIASSECFPNVDISEVISALKNGFGIRFLFDDSYKRVRIVLLRNIFRNKEVQNVDCDIIGEEKTENSIRGFKMTYGDSDDTEFYYKGFDDLLPHKKELWIDKTDKHDYSRWNLDANYTDLIHKISAFDTTCYVTKNTGNAFGIKVDKDAKRYDELHPSLFEFAAYMPAEDGDCTGEDETIETVTTGFKPAIMNDCNFENERDNNEREQHYALFVEEQMQPRRPDLKDLTLPKSYDDSDAVYDTAKMDKMYGKNGTDTKMVNDGVVAPGSFAVASDLYVEAAFPGQVTLKSINGAFKTTISNIKISGHLSEGYRLYLQDNFEPNDNGISPIETHDWGLTLGIMRGSGSDAYVNYSGDPNDEEGNDTWDVVSGSNVTAHPDTCDTYGRLWDYKGGMAYSTDAEAIAGLSNLWSDSNIDLIHSSDTTMRTSQNYISLATVVYSKNEKGDKVALMFATQLADGTKIFSGTTKNLEDYVKLMEGMTAEQMYAYDKRYLRLLIEVGSSNERADTLVALEKLAFGGGKPVYVDNGVGVEDGRFSLKLRAEKLNPYFGKDVKIDGVDTTKRYLPIDNKDLRGRGLCDQFYKEYSYWVRNSRIAKLTVHLELAQFLAIDKTKRVKIGDYQGFIKKMEFTVSNKTGLGNVTIELMYI